MTIWKDDKQLLAEQLQRAYDCPPSSDNRFQNLLDRINQAVRENALEDAD